MNASFKNKKTCPLQKAECGGLPEIADSYVVTPLIHVPFFFQAPEWLFPLAFHADDNIKYYACLAIAALVANKEIEAAVLRSGTLELVEPFVTSHDPDAFAQSTVAHVHGQSQSWLHKLVPVLDSKREEARSLAAFHFAMEAGIKKRQGNTKVGGNSLLTLLYAKSRD